MKKYKAVTENNAIINTSVNSKESIKIWQMLNNLKQAIFMLDRYECTANSGGQDCWTTMELEQKGEYIKLEDILNLFSPKNK